MNNVTKQSHKLQRIDTGFCYTQFLAKLDEMDVMGVTMPRVQSANSMIKGSPQIRAIAKRLLERTVEASYAFSNEACNIIDAKRSALSSRLCKLIEDQFTL
jgi:hypothetical protein